MAKIKGDNRRRALEAFVEQGPGFYPSGPLPEEAAAPEPAAGPSPGASLLGDAARLKPAGDEERLTVPLPRKIARGALGAARDRGMTLAAFVTRALKREIKRARKKLKEE
jgi:hypothetical protein